MDRWQAIRIFAKVAETAGSAGWYFNQPKAGLQTAHAIASSFNN